MTERDALLDLQARWAAVGVETEVTQSATPMWHLYGKENWWTWVISRERWRLGAMPPEALRVFADWVQEGEVTT